MYFFFFFQAEDGIRDADVTGVQTCALPICWVAAHASLIYTPPDLTSGHTLSVIDPPNPEGGCVAQLSYEYHFNLPETEWEFIQGEIERALWTDIATGACNSDSGSGTDV